MDEQKQECQSCRWLARIGNFNDFGQCRRRSPSGVPHYWHDQGTHSVGPVSDSVVSFGRINVSPFPLVQLTDVCGDYERG